MKKSFSIIFIVSLLLLSSSISLSAQERFNVPIEDSPTQGPSNAPITMIKFLDYQ